MEVRKNNLEVSINVYDELKQLFRATELPRDMLDVEGDVQVIEISSSHTNNLSFVNKHSHYGARSAKLSSITTHRLKQMPDRFSYNIAKSKEVPRHCHVLNKTKPKQNKRVVI